MEHVLLRKGIEAVYQPFLPKGTHPFVYLSLTIKPEHLDVNVHPTKQIVQFLNADAIVERICSLVQESLAAHNVSRTFYTQVGVLFDNRVFAY